MRTPNFFIIGAPKCGTTSLSEYLREHPQVFMAYPKEPNYFCSDFPSRQAIRTQQEYDFLFRNVTDAHQAIGEASVHYLRSRVAVQALLEQYPHARFIVMVRDPMDFLPSWHAQMLESLTEDVHDFEMAWRLTDSRRQGRNLPRRCAEPAMLDYHAAARFGEQVERLLGHVDRGRVLFIRYDDFARDTHAIYDRVLEFLDVKPDDRKTFPRINPRSAVRSRLLRRWLPSITRLRRKVGIPDEGRLRGALHWIATTVGGWNLKAGPRPHLSDQTIQEIRGMFRSDIELLARLTGLQLACWQTAREKLTPLGAAEDDARHLEMTTDRTQQK